MTTIADIRTKFKDQSLLEQALTHRSWINENPGIRHTNERLEFLGDAILEYIVSAELYRKLPDKEEGFLTALRANIVNTKNLSEVAIKLNIGEELYVSKGEEASGGRSNISLLADTVEAILGSIYLDQGLDAAEKFVMDNLLVDLDTKLAEPLKDPKSRLQEQVQAQGNSTPKYEVIEESGPDHAKKFTVAVSVGNKRVAAGVGNSKSIAEQKAAEAALEKLSSNS